MNIWNQLIINTEQTSIYISTFPNALSSKMVQNHEISMLFNKLNRSLDITHLHNPEIQNALVSKRNTLLSFKIVNRYVNIPPLMPDEDKNFGGSLVLDFRK